MSNIHHHHHVKKERVDNSPSSTTRAPYSLKISKDSHPIKKSTTSSPPSSFSSSATPSSKVAAKPQQRRPVIIYTHSPKIIHTHPKDFMALVQKLTGLSRSNSHNHRNHYDPNERKKVVNKGTPAPANDDNESTSVVTDDHNGGCETQVNSCFVSPAMFDPATNLCFSGYPFYGPNAAEFWYSDHHHHHSQLTQLFNYNYSDDSSFLYMPEISSSSPFDSMKELPKF